MKMNKGLGSSHLPGSICGILITVSAPFTEQGIAVGRAGVGCPLQLKGKGVWRAAVVPVHTPNSCRLPRFTSLVTAAGTPAVLHRSMGYVHVQCLRGKAQAWSQGGCCVWWGLTYPLDLWAPSPHQCSAGPPRPAVCVLTHIQGPTAACMPGTGPGSFHLSIHAHMSPQCPAQGLAQGKCP